MRLGTYLVVNRLVGKPEDGRYQELRRRWAPHEQRRFFVFFQAQAGFVTVFSLPFAFVAVDDGRVSWLAWAGGAVAGSRDRGRGDGRHATGRVAGPIPATAARPAARTASGARPATPTTSSSGCTGSAGP